MRKRGQFNIVIVAILVIALVLLVGGIFLPKIVSLVSDIFGIFGEEEKCEATGKTETDYFNDFDKFLRGAYNVNTFLTTASLTCRDYKSCFKRPLPAQYQSYFTDEFNKLLKKTDYQYEELSKTGQDICSIYKICFDIQFPEKYKKEISDKIVSLNKNQKYKLVTDAYVTYVSCFPGSKLSDEVLLIVANAYYEISKNCDSYYCIQGLWISISIYSDVLSRQPENKKELSYKILKAIFARSLSTQLPYISGEIEAEYKDRIDS